MNLQNFPGVVITQNWNVAPSGHDVRGYIGMVSIIEAKDIGSGSMTGKDANWIARITSADGSRSVNILGCQVHAISQFASMEDVRSQMTGQFDLYDVENMGQIRGA